MTENDKAAVAAGRWEPGHKCLGQAEQDIHGNPNPQACGRKSAWVEDPDRRPPHWSMTPIKHVEHESDAPDMHEPGNLWRALETVPKNIRMGILFRLMNCDNGAELRDFAFAALVAVYDADHKA